VDIPVCEAVDTEFCVRCNFSRCAVLVVPEYSSSMQVKPKFNYQTPYRQKSKWVII